MLEQDYSPRITRAGPPRSAPARHGPALLLLYCRSVRGPQGRLSAIRAKHRIAQGLWE